MNFITYTNAWTKSEITQRRIMISISILLFIVFYGILPSQNELLKGVSIPLSLLLLILTSYGSYILYSRANHAKESISIYKKSEKKQWKRK